MKIRLKGYNGEVEIEAEQKQFDKYSVPQPKTEDLLKGAVELYKSLETANK